jgi:hypothetical protein
VLGLVLFVLGFALLMYCLFFNLVKVNVGEWVRVEPELNTLTDGTPGYNPVQLGEERWVGNTHLENIGVIQRPAGAVVGLVAVSVGLAALYANRENTRFVYPRTHAPALWGR